MENGKLAVLSQLKNGIGFGSTEFHTSRFHPEINTQFYFYYFSQEAFRREAKREMTGSAGQLRVPSGYFREIILPLPPLAEQNRIVAKIEELFSDLEHSVAALKTAREQFRIYREAVLKFALEGKLTEKWRANNLDDSLQQSIERLKKEKEQAVKEKKIIKDYYFREIRLEEIPHSIPNEWVWLPWKTITANEKYSMRRGPFGSAIKKSFFVPKGYHYLCM